MDCDTHPALYRLPESVQQAFPDAPAFSTGREFRHASDAFAYGQALADKMGSPVECGWLGTWRTFFPAALRQRGYR